MWHNAPIASKLIIDLPVSKGFDCGRYLSIMVCRMILLVIGVHNSSQSFGSTCSNFSTFRLSFLRAIIPKQMAKLSVPTKRWNNIFVVSSTINKMIGLIICTWRNSLTTTQHILPQDISHFSRIRVVILDGR